MQRQCDCAGENTPGAGRAEGSARTPCARGRSHVCDHVVIICPRRPRHTPPLPWMLCRCFLGWSASSHERGSAARCEQGARHPVVPGVRCVASRQRSRERDSRKVHGHRFLTLRGGQTGASGARFLPPQCCAVLPVAHAALAPVCPPRNVTLFCR